MAHWTYKETPDADSLEQGDLLKKTDDLYALLKTYHPHYADHPNNQFFIVLTQSCDLVQRDGSRCKTRYISLAPVRSLKAVLKREFEEKLENVGPGSQPFASTRTRSVIEQFLEKLFNNNDPSFFYLERHPTAGVSEDMCALLALPIAIKAEHYEKCFAARVLSIKDEFQAKIGWLIGQLYSRVGTRDWEKPQLSAKVADASSKAAVWLADEDVKALVDLCKSEREATPDGTIDKRKLTTLLAQVPKKKETAIQRILDIATAAGVIATPSPQRRAFRRALENDTQFALYFNK